MFDLFGDDGDSGGHDEAVAELQDQFSQFGGETRADHLEGHDQPDPVNGRIPDLSYDHPGPGKTYVEVDSTDKPTERDREQLNDIREGMGRGDRLIRVTEDEVSPFDGLL